MTFSEAIEEAVWLKAFMRELNEEAGNNAIKVFEDIEGVIVLTTNPEFRERT